MNEIEKGKDIPIPLEKERNLGVQRRGRGGSAKDFQVLSQTSNPNQTMSQNPSLPQHQRVPPFKEEKKEKETTPCNEKETSTKNGDSSFAHVQPITEETTSSTSAVDRKRQPVEAASLFSSLGAKQKSLSSSRPKTVHETVPPLSKYSQLAAKPSKKPSPAADAEELIDSDPFSRTQNRPFATDPVPQHHSEIQPTGSTRRVKSEKGGTMSAKKKNENPRKVLEFESTPLTSAQVQENPSQKKRESSSSSGTTTTPVTTVATTKRNSLEEGHAESDLVRILKQSECTNLLPLSLYMADQLNRLRDVDLIAKLFFPSLSLAHPKVSGKTATHTNASQPAPPLSLQSMSAMSGTLAKRSDVWKDFRLRYVLLVGNVLLWYKSEMDTQLLGSLFLDHEATIERNVPADKDDNARHCFRVKTSSRSLLMGTFQREDHNRWCHALENRLPWWTSAFCAQPQRFKDRASTAVQNQEYLEHCASSSTQTAPSLPASSAVKELPSKIDSVIQMTDSIDSCSSTEDEYGDRPQVHDPLLQASLNGQLWKAIEKGDADTAARMVEEGANVKYINENGDDLLTLAAKQNNVECTALLLQSGAYVPRLASRAVTMTTDNEVKALLLDSMEYQRNRRDSHLEKRRSHVIASQAKTETDGSSSHEKRETDGDFTPQTSQEKQEGEILIEQTTAKEKASSISDGTAEEVGKKSDEENMVNELQLSTSAFAADGSESTRALPARTSITHPLQVVFLKSSLILPGRIGMCMCPGRNKPKKGFRWARDATSDIQRIRDTYKGEVVVSLVRDQEKARMGISNLTNLVEAEGLQSISCPITDKWIPSSMDMLCELITQIIGLLQSGHTVVIHCNGGKGRTAMVVVAVLIALGLPSVREAISLCRSASNGMLKNPAQQFYLRYFKKYWYRKRRTPQMKEIMERNKEVYKSDKNILRSARVDARQARSEARHSRQLHSSGSGRFGLLRRPSLVVRGRKSSRASVPNTDSLGSIGTPVAPGDESASSSGERVASGEAGSDDAEIHVKIDPVEGDDEASPSRNLYVSTTEPMERVTPKSK